MINTIENRYIWLNGEIINFKNAQINILSPTSQFGANVFEGIRCYWNSDNKKLYGFRLDEHYLRLQKSIRMLKIEEKYSLKEMKQALFDVVNKEQYDEDIAVRQTVFVDGNGSWSSKGPAGMFVAPIPKGLSSVEYNKKGLNCCISTWRRISDQNLSPRIKCGANYMNSRMAQLEAWDNNYDCAILLNENGKLAEGPGSCLFIVRDNKLITPSLSSSILESITRDTIIQIATDLDLIVVEREIDRTEVYICDEAFLCGSAMEITPIYSVDGYEINNKMGEITKKIYNLYMDIVRGKNKKYMKWLTEVK
ncbi:branched-chain amino acid transaminase [Candidatus Stoquefichus sp. SB1]|uniref:branched-chain amino acid transaminase n=1 Tax=Candidatus Stoquefichus sp. SB1 TaxID=1658109 RepID=UPI00067E9307|nr:branched-chain amino acid transaminase [Candidatus Stoquefichus sp. SB1]